MESIDDGNLTLSPTADMRLRAICNDDQDCQYGMKCMEFTYFMSVKNCEYSCDSDAVREGSDSGCPFPLVCQLRTHAPSPTCGVASKNE
jgi:hypothetical protein